MTLSATIEVKADFGSNRIELNRIKYEFATSNRGRGELVFNSVRFGKRLIFDNFTVEVLTPTFPFIKQEILINYVQY